MTMKGFLGRRYCMDVDDNCKKVINENKQVYESLRNEIISMQELQRNVWIYMYVLFGTLFVLGLQWSHYLFLVTYIILIPFQCVINDYLWSVSKISTYIRVFFENERNDMNWESFHLYDPYQEYYRKKNNSLIGFIRISGSVHLGIIATGFFCGYTLINNWNRCKFAIGSMDMLAILLSLVLFFVILKINNDYNKEYYMELEKIMKKYKLELENKENE